MNDLFAIMEQLTMLTLLEASTLVKQIEKTFDVDASGVKIQSLSSSEPEASKKEETEEKTEFELILTEVPADKKITILKVVRSITGLGLRESKTLVEAAPQTVQKGMTKEAAEAAKTQLDAVGATSLLK
jgi:large subunit ribosomal protein L7/L12